MNDPTKTNGLVWDLPVRLFHWALVALVAFQTYTGLGGGPADMVWHGRAGYAILALVVFRVLWGFVGGRHARFGDFLKGPKGVVEYLTGKVPHGAGHNPLGGLSVIAMLVVLAAQAATGLFSNDDILFEGPLMAQVGKDMSDTITGYHALSAKLLLALVVLHLAAIVFYRIKGRNLIHPMITGRSPDAETDDENGPPAAASLIKALIALAIAAAAVWAIVTQ